MPNKRFPLPLQSVEFLIPLLAENPEKSEYYRKVTPKGIRTIFFYVADSTNADTNADNNGAYTKTRNATKLYTIAVGQVFIVIEMMLSIFTNST